MTHSFRYRVEWLALVSFRALVRLLPLRLTNALGSGVGWMVGVVWHRRRQIAQANLTRAFPEWTPAEVRNIATRVFKNFGRTSFEILAITRDTSCELLQAVDCPPLDIIDVARSKGRGVILLSGHIGNWELFAGYLKARGYPIDVIVKPMRNPLSDSFYNSRRRDLGVGIIHTQTATRGIVDALKNQRMIAILADQHAGAEGVDVQFFNRSASTPRGPAALALRFGCPILSGVMVRSPESRFRVEIDPPLEFVPTGKTEEDVQSLTQICTARIEAHIRSYPDQWLWTHRRWRDSN